ncbi:hypothetical protein B0H14DRAFT_3784637 [Mycena olivaceomarginata]|nr:hypothetical protein B0H14DRAFT_3784637 [Mycena olivaceomarginata]
MAIEVEFWSLAVFRGGISPSIHLSSNALLSTLLAALPITPPARPQIPSVGIPTPTATRAAWNGRTSALRWAGDDESNDSNPGNWAGESALSSDSDDDVLEVCLSRSRYNSSRDSLSSRSPNGAWPSFARALSKTSTSKTITPIVPVRLKTTGVGNGWEGGEWVGTRDEGLPEEVQHLLPRNGAAVNLAAQNMLSSAFDTDDSCEEDADAGQEDEVFTHRSAYFSADCVYDYLGGPDLGVEFGPTLEPRGRRGSTSTGAEVLEIETEGAAPSPLRSRSKSRSKSRSCSRTPWPAIPSSSPNGASGVGVSVPPGAASPRSPAGSLFSPRRAGTTRRSRPPPPLRSSHTSPLGSLSSEYGGVRMSADYGFGGYAYAGLVKGIRRGGHGSVSPEGGASVSPEKVWGGTRRCRRRGRLDVEFGVERGDGNAPAGGGERRADGGGGVLTGRRTRPSMRRGRQGMQRHVEFGLDDIGNIPGVAGHHTAAAQICQADLPPTSESIPISPPRAWPVNGVLPIEEEVPEYESTYARSPSAQCRGPRLRLVVRHLQGTGCGPRARLRLVLLRELLACGLSSVAATVPWMRLSSPEGVFGDVRAEWGHSLVKKSSDTPKEADLDMNVAHYHTTTVKIIICCFSDLGMHFYYSQYL